MWRGGRRNSAEKEAMGTVVVEQPPPTSVRMEDAWVKPALGGVVIQCPHPECYKDWYSPIGGIRIGRAIEAIEEHIAKKHS